MVLNTSMRKGASRGFRVKSLAFLHVSIQNLKKRGFRVILSKVCKNHGVFDVFPFQNIKKQVLRVVFKQQHAKTMVC